RGAQGCPIHRPAPPPRRGRLGGGVGSPDIWARTVSYFNGAIPIRRLCPRTRSAGHSPPILSLQWLSGRPTGQARGQRRWFWKYRAEASCPRRRRKNYPCAPTGGEAWPSSGAYLVNRPSWLIEKITVSGMMPQTLKATQISVEKLRHNTSLSTASATKNRPQLSVSLLQPSGLSL